MNGVTNKSAWVSALCGTFVTLALNSKWLGSDLPRGLWIVVTSNLAGFFALFSTIQLESIPRVKKSLLKNTFLTWLYIASVYFLIVLTLAPELRGLRSLSVFFLPLLMSTGWMLMGFGPLQDKIVRKRWERNRLKKSPH